MTVMKGKLSDEVLKGKKPKFDGIA